MALDSYSYCPGGTGKKIKFCCGDFLTELEKIDRMVEGEQYLAALKHIDRQLAREPGRDRACLLATQSLLLRVTGQRDAAAEVVAKFVEKYPDNQIALAESAILKAEEDCRQAFALLQKAIRAAQGQLALRTCQAIEVVATMLFHDGYVVAAHALLDLRADVDLGDRRAEELLFRLEQADQLPLLLRDDPALMPAPDDAPWKDQLDEAIKPTEIGDWLTAADRLATLVAKQPDAPVVWRDLAVVRGWTADHAGAAEAWRKYALLRSGEESGLEDAAEAEALAMFLSEDPLGDRLDLVMLTWTVDDQQRVQEGLLSSPQLRPISFDPARFSDGETPPPKGAFLVLSRPAIDLAEGLTLETMPRVLGHAMLFGKQTDREARLEMLGVAADDLPAVKQILHQAAGEAIDPEPEQRVVGHTSTSRRLLHPAWRPPQDVSDDKLRELTTAYLRDAVFHQWPEQELPVLDNRSPRETAVDPNSRARVLGAILVLQHWLRGVPVDIDLNELRSQLGIPSLGPVDPHAQPLAMLSSVRLERIDAMSLSDEELLELYDRARRYANRPAYRKFARLIIDRPSLAQSDVRLHAFSMLARSEESIAQALAYIDQGRRAAEARGISSVTWDLLELSTRFAERNGEAASRLIDHIQRRHIEEPGVANTLTQMLISVGLLRPDGTPVALPDAPEPEMPEAAEPAEPGRLWTPDSAQPGGGGKLWTPE